MNKSLIYISLFFLGCLIISCQTDSSSNENAKVDSLFIKKIITEAPPLTPEEALQTMVIENGFEVKLVAAEPLVSSPVAMSFDNKGRIWVAEMEGYMPDTDGSGEDVPSGKVVILEDNNKDGVTDVRKIFLDSLVLPRALCFIENGILIAEPPYLWYYEIENDKPINKTLVDSTYAAGDNVEHQPNGLYRAMDNWIYNGSSNKRYRKKGNQWLVEITHQRGQWGISQDDYGRLYYNNNSQNLLGDYFSPGLGSTNPNQQKVFGFTERVVKDNKVFPIRPTPGVNRGYQDNVLDDSLRLKTFTAASGPVIYRGALFGKEYENNAFVGEPAANLIKRNILKQEGNSITGEQAYQGKEFLASYDERFRPVSLYDGPDGALYVVDMYRGIIQHKLYLTEYLKGEIHSRNLEKPINYGRIYKIVPKGKKTKPFIFPTDPVKLAKLFDNENGWIRDRAQQTIIDNKLIKAVPLLKKNLKNIEHPIALVHSLWTLEGLNSLKADDILALLNVSNQEVRKQALTVLPAVLDGSNYKSFIPVLREMVSQKDSIIAPFVAFQVNAIQKFDSKAAKEILVDLTKAFPNDQYVIDAIISNLKDKENEFYKEVLSTNSQDTSLQIVKRLRKVMDDIEKNSGNQDIHLSIKKYPRGVSVFQSTCQPCHGADGNGIESLAPPLNTSNWVQGDKDKLISIVLYGLRGPVKVNNKLYDKINGEMPGIGNNKDLVDEDIAQLLSFIRNYWSNTASNISRDDVLKIRKKFKDRQNAFTTAELDKWK